MMNEYSVSFEEAKERLASYAAMRSIPVSRRLNRLSDLNKPLGVHWSAGEAANEHTKSYGEIVVLGRVSNENVDWITAVTRAMFWWHEEREITICANAPVRLVSMTFGADVKGVA